ncbi:hypothetical protein EVAR_5886_1 [Eumeta japonica]|uniref:Uncharacterized protein n=1 Tax=Eumeta variegata TaxID=151549 RepID=A0A4C1TFH5_EUMVA|nr:hypothetical protein EVAR_5886_1 [Eumeta japonica]
MTDYFSDGERRRLMKLLTPSSLHQLTLSSVGYLILTHEVDNTLITLLESRLINTVQMRSPRDICGVFLKDRCKNSDVREQCRLKEDVGTRVEKAFGFFKEHQLITDYQYGFEVAAQLVIFMKQYYLQVSYYYYLELKDNNSYDDVNIDISKVEE